MVDQMLDAEFWGDSGDWWQVRPIVRPFRRVWRRRRRHLRPGPSLAEALLRTGALERRSGGRGWIRRWWADRVRMRRRRGGGGVGQIRDGAGTPIASDRREYSSKGAPLFPRIEAEPVRPLWSCSTPLDRVSIAKLIRATQEEVMRLETRGGRKGGGDDL
jgi:hypothetical protein